MDVNISDEDIENIIHDMDFDMTAYGVEHDGGVSLAGFEN